MTVDVFIKQVAMNKNREEYIKQRIIKQYIPYEEKILRCEQIINISSYIEVEGRKVYRVNTPVRFVFTALTIINEYTDIQINFGDESFLNDYNLLDQNGLIEELIKAIPHHEHDTWMMLLQMISDDKQENERSLISYLDDKLDAFNMVLTTALENAATLLATESESGKEE